MDSTSNDSMPIGQGYDAPMPGPPRPPIGLTLARASKSVGRAFEDALAAAGGSTSTWLVLLSLKTQPQANQRALAESVGIQGATLTHHLNAMEDAGLVTRRRDPSNRRVHLVEVTGEGEALFHRLRTAAMAFDRRLRSGLDGADLAQLEQLLERLVANARPS
jgi:MarR family transcriptional regulator for hemolysin